MPRVVQADESALSGELAELTRKFTASHGDFTNQVKVLAHSPEAFRHLYGLIDAWRTNASLSQRLVEIAGVGLTLPDAPDEEDRQAQAPDSLGLGQRP